MKKKFNSLFKTVFNIFLGLLEFFTFYFIIAILLSLVPYNRDHKNDDGEIEIFILSNGVHTDIVLPAVNEYKDWTKEIPTENTVAQDPDMYYLAFGWGDKGFYLNTPQWSDLTFSTAFKAMFALSTSAMHVTYYKNVRTSEKCKKIKIGKDAYLKLVQYIEDSFQKERTGNFLHIKGHQYGDTDSFYEAIGSYSLFYTCNTWTNEALKHCGVRSCLWTPFDKGMFYHYNN